MAASVTPNHLAWVRFPAVSMFRTTGRSITYFMFSACFTLLFFRPVMIEGAALSVPNSLGLGITRNFLRLVYFMTNGSNLVGFNHWLTAKIAALCRDGGQVYTIHEHPGGGLLTRFVMDRGKLVCKNQELNRGFLFGAFDEMTERKPHQMDRLSLVLVGPRIHTPWVLNFYLKIYALLHPAVLFVLQFFILCSQILEFEEEEEEEPLGHHYFYTLLALCVLVCLCYHSLLLGK